MPMARVSALLAIARSGLMNKSGRWGERSVEMGLRADAANVENP